MVNDFVPIHFCYMCPEIIGEQCEGFVFCPRLNQKVWAMSVMCPHGEDLLECF